MTEPAQSILDSHRAHDDLLSKGSIEISHALNSEIESQALGDYPLETCGFLLGEESGPSPCVTRLLPALNRSEGDRRRRFAIDREGYEAAETLCSRSRLRILGIYHSHPDTEPIPSATDSEFAFPEWIYWITPVHEGQAGPARAWRRSLNGKSWRDMKIAIGDHDSQTHEHHDPLTHWRDTVDSTNAEAMRLGNLDAPNLTAVVARYQTAGRGQRGRTWIMPRDQGVLLSILYQQLPHGVTFPELTLKAAQVLAELLQEITGLQLEIKEPNDLLIDGKKVGGILSEAAWRGEVLECAVLGVGINVNVAVFPDELRDTACSLAQASGRRFDIEELSREVIRRLRRMESVARCSGSIGSPAG